MRQFLAPAPLVREYMNRRTLLVLAALALGVAIAFRMHRLDALISAAPRQTAVLYDAETVRVHPNAQTEWDGYLTAQGIPHRWIEAGDLALIRGAELKARFRMILLPKPLVPEMSDDLSAQLRDYTRSGGRLLIVVRAPEPRQARLSLDRLGMTREQKARINGAATKS